MKSKETRYYSLKVGISECEPHHPLQVLGILQQQINTFNVDETKKIPVLFALVVELVDTPVLEAGAERHESSSLSWGTKYRLYGEIVYHSSLRNLRSRLES
jgi:hypothetical protein